MKYRKPPHQSRRVSPFLLVLIGGSIMLLSGGSFLFHSLVSSQQQNTDPANTRTKLAGGALSIHAPTVPPITISIPAHNNMRTPTGTLNAATGTPTNPSQGPSTPPAGNPGTTLPPGSVLPGESTCA